jgi:apolipoprotein N-acyltransferase
MFRRPLYSFDPKFELPVNATSTIEEVSAYGPQGLADLVKQLGTPILVGIDRAHFLPDSTDGLGPPPADRFNSAVLVGHDGKIVGTYDKMHRVMFGEYIPFADWLPFLYKVTPLTGGIVAGKAPAALILDQIHCFVPNICYETAIPHVIRRQVAALEAQGYVPDALVNMTNDAWYWGSNELDMHLACGVFRAVETRLSLVIAANGGISAWIDPFGRVKAESPRLRPDILIADIEPSALRSAYVRYGDWFAALCLLCCVVLAMIGWRTRRSPLPTATNPPPHSLA